MARKKRKWHPEFIRYMKTIAEHPNYRDLPEPFDNRGEIKWVVAGNSVLGKKRARWWDKQVKKRKKKNRAEVARAIHPKKLNGMKPCQICGKKLSIFYVYPNINTLKKIRKLSGKKFKQYDKTIDQIFSILWKSKGEKTFEIFSGVFEIPKKIKKTKREYLRYVISHSTSKLGPGVMSNAPDRFDGFHSYNACCRGREDTGRHGSNLARYSQDRRAYENWAEGDWNLANRLMGEFKRYTQKVSCPKCGKLRKMTADHIGPISLGFTHRPEFNPLCNSCNSGKNNRMNYKDVKRLLREEANGKKVISWHSKEMWDSIKKKIKNDQDAKKASRMMGNHLKNVLYLMSEINKQGFDKFLGRFLNPNYSFFDYRFTEFNPLALDEMKIKKAPLDSKNKKKNAKRYVRISFDSLKKYRTKKNRKIKIWENKKIKKLREELFLLLEQGHYKKAENKLKSITREMAKAELKGVF